MAIEERLQLDVTEALKGVDKIGEALTRSATEFKVGLADALSLLSQITVADVDASGITSAIDDAVAAADVSPEIEADASTITASIDDAVSAADPVVDVTADAESITTSIDQAVAEADPSVEVQAMTDQITAQVEDAVGSADAVVPVEADTSGMTDEIESAVGSVDATVSVEADTSAAQSEIESLSGSASEAKGNLDGLSTAAKGVSAGANLATGSTAGLEGAVAALNPELAAGAAAAAGIAGGLQVLISSAIQSDTATRRLAISAGDFAAQIDGINIEGFASNLTDLAEKAGQDDEALRLAAARIFDLGHSAGASGPQIATTAEQILLLATRAATLNPTLGQAGDVAERMTQALSRGGRFAAQFGIALQATEIEARALADNVGKTAEDLTVYEKAAAGAAIASERLGDSLKSGIVEGAQGAEIQVRSVHEGLKNFLEDLGKPLIAPFIDVLTQAIPVAEELGRVLGDLGEIALPLIADALKLLGPPLKLLADALDFVSASADNGGNALEKAHGKVSGFEPTARAVTDLWHGLGEGIKRTGDDSTEAAGAIGEAASTVGFAALNLSAFGDAQTGANAGLLDAATNFKIAAAAAQQYQAAIAHSLTPLVDVQSATLQVAGLELELEKNLNGTSKAARSGADATDRISGARRSLKDANEGVVKAEEKLQRFQDEEIPKRLAAAEQKVADTAHSVEQAQRAEADARDKLNRLEAEGGGIDKELAAAESAVEKATRGVLDARRGEVDAEEKLNHVRDVEIPRRMEELSKAVASANRDQADSARALEDAQRSLNEVEQDYADALDRADISAERSVLRLQDATDRVAELNAKLRELQTTPLKAGETQAERNREITKTQREILSAQLDVRDATHSETDAQKKLDDLRGPGHQRDVEAAMQKVSDAQDRQTAAAEKARDANRDLNDFLNGGAQRLVADAELALTDAHTRSTDAAKAEADAQQALNDLQNGGIQREMADAERAVEDAHRSTEQATRAAAEATRLLNDEQTGAGQTAHDLADLQDGVTKSLERVTTAQEGLEKASRTTGGAVEENTNTFDLHTAAGVRNLEILNNLVAAREQLIAKLIAEQAPQKVIDDLKQEEIEKLETLKKQHPELTELIDKYIIKIKEVPTEKATKFSAETQEAEAAIAKLKGEVEAFGPGGGRGAALEAAVSVTQKTEFTLGGGVVSASNPLPVTIVGGAARMAGGPVWPGTDFVVGEEGPEVVRFDKPGWVFNAEQTRTGRATSSGGLSDAQLARLERSIIRAVESQRPIIVNEVANDPRATATAVDVRLGERAGR